MIKPFNPKKDYTGFHNPKGVHTAKSYWYMPEKERIAYDKRNKECYDKLVLEHEDRKKVK